MHTRIRLAIIVAVLFIAFLLLACGNGPNPSDDYCNQTYGSTYDGKPVKPVGC
jgi:hypothetical protein